MRPQSRRLFAMLLSPIGLYFAAAGVLSHVPVNHDWREPADGVTIYLASNGIHTGIVVPVTSAGMDWRGRVRTSDLPDPKLAGPWLLFGWGDREFYVNTPTWKDLRPGTALSAVFGSGQTLVHVDHFGDFYADADMRPLRLTTEEYRRLSDFIERTFADSREVVPGYGPRDVFYAAKGRYSIFRTCNVWTGDALKYAGVQTAVWSPFPSGIMRWAKVPPPGTSTQRTGR
jgi:uncharacterized protein (TIGR02117 family)